MVSWKMPLSMQKMEVWRWVSKNGFVAKVVKNTKMELRKVKKLGKVIFREEIV